MKTTTQLVHEVEDAVNKAFDCEIVRVDASLSWNAAVVTICRPGHHPRGADYSTHYYAGCNKGLHHGHYDMPYRVAMSDHTDRAMREWG